MNQLHEARFYEALPDRRVLCTLCPHDCRIPDGGLGAEVPWHVSQFYPAHKMLDRPVTPLETLHRAGDIGRAAGLRYVYEGNVPGEQGENTYCYHCHSLLIDHYGFYVRANRIRGGACPDCGASSDGVGMNRDSVLCQDREERFL